MRRADQNKLSLSNESRTVILCEQDKSFIYKLWPALWKGWIVIITHLVASWLMHMSSCHFVSGKLCFNPEVNSLRNWRLLGVIFGNWLVPLYIDSFQGPEKSRFIFSLYVFFPSLVAACLHLFCCCHKQQSSNYFTFSARSYSKTRQTDDSMADEKNTRFHQVLKS